MMKLELWELRVAMSGMNDENVMTVDVVVECPADTTAGLAVDGASLLCSSSS